MCGESSKKSANRESRKHFVELSRCELAELGALHRDVARAEDARFVGDRRCRFEVVSRHHAHLT